MYTEKEQLAEQLALDVPHAVLGGKLAVALWPLVNKQQEARSLGETTHEANASVPATVHQLAQTTKLSFRSIWDMVQIVGIASLVTIVTKYRVQSHAVDGTSVVIVRK